MTNKPLRVLSLFDGISCGQIALARAGIKVDQYFASEIDKHAIQVTQKNYPKTIQVGDVTKLRGADLPKIFLLIGGSPCQGFSFAGKQLNFEDSRSKLFFEFVRLLEETKAKYFLLENVKMKKESQDVISKCLGVEPIVINSNLVSAQNRVRYYWTNIPNVTAPEDKNIFLKDILKDGSDTVGAIRGRYLADKITTEQYLEIRAGGKSNCLTTVQKDNVVILNKNTVLQGRDRIEWKNVKKDQVRKLTALEYERLQTVDDNYTEGLPNSYRYKILGNAWTVDLIVHIFKGLIKYF